MIAILRQFEDEKLDKEQLEAYIRIGEPLVNIVVRRRRLFAKMVSVRVDVPILMP